MQKIIITLGLILTLGGISFFIWKDGFRLFEMSPTISTSEGRPLSSPSFETPSEKLTEPISEHKPLLPSPPARPQKLTLEQIQEELDDIAEKIDILTQEVAELTGATILPQVAGVTEEVPEEEEELEDEEDSSPSYCQILSYAQAKRDKIIINEIAWMGTDISANSEWIELKNVSRETIDLTNWQIVDKENKIGIISKGILPAGGFYLLERTSDDSVQKIKADLIFTGAIKNSEITLYLFDENCRLRDKTGANPDWPAGDNSSKQTMERKDDLSWQTSKNPGGTPKKENSGGYVITPTAAGGGAPPPSYPKILISEVKISENTGDKNIFIELYNPNDFEVDLTNWYIFRNDSSFITKTLLSGKKISPKAYLLITRKGSIWENQADVLFDDETLNEDDKITLKNPKGEVVDEVYWSQAPLGFSSSRKWNEEGQEYQDTDNNSEDFEIQIPTPKAQNQSPEPEPEPEPEPTPEDNIPPVVILNLELIQTSLSFIISWSGEDLASEGIEPSGIAGYQLRYSQDEENWEYYPSAEDYTQETQYNFTGENETTYYFQIKARDLAGNESDWVKGATKISLPKPILITEVQIEGNKKSYDFIEIYNPNNLDISLKSYRLVKRAATSQSDTTIKSWSRDVDPKIIAKSYYLWAWAATEDNNFAASINTDISTSQTISTNNGIAIREGDEDVGEIIDTLGWGNFSNVLFETSPFISQNEDKNPGKNQSIERQKDADGNYIDTNDNSQDFFLQENPNPKNQSLDLTGPNCEMSISNTDWENLTFTVTWSSPDTDIAFYNVQVKIGEDEWQNWFENTTETQADYIAPEINDYWFRVRATDKLYNQGDWVAAGPASPPSETGGSG